MAFAANFLSRLPSFSPPVWVVGCSGFPGSRIWSVSHTGNQTTLRAIYSPHSYTLKRSLDALCQWKIECPDVHWHYFCWYNRHQEWKLTCTDCSSRKAAAYLLFYHIFFFKYDCVRLKNVTSFWSRNIFFLHHD